MVEGDKRENVKKEYERKRASKKIKSGHL